MKKKVFFVLSSFSAGGAERVFWLLCQAFDKTKYDVTIVLLNTKNNAFDLKLPQVRVIDLNTIKASSSFLPLFKLLGTEKPFAVYSTGGHINFLVSLVSLFVKIPINIARSTNIPNERIIFLNLKSRLISRLTTLAFRRFDYLVCQSAEMLNAWKLKDVIDPARLLVIPNPVAKTNILNRGDLFKEKRLLIVAKLSAVKGHLRLLNVMSNLSEEYHLTIAGGDGGLMGQVKSRIKQLSLQNRVTMMGEVDNVTQLMSQYSVLVLSSFTEGFPNVVLESLSVGTPVVTFKVGGVSDFISNDFNGYLIEQGDMANFKEAIKNACNKKWDHKAIAADIQRRFSIDSVVKQYERLIE